MNRINEKELKQLFTELKSSNNKVAFEHYISSIINLFIELLSQY